MRHGSKLGRRGMRLKAPALWELERVSSRERLVLDPPGGEKRDVGEMIRTS